MVVRESTIRARKNIPLIPPSTSTQNTQRMHILVWRGEKGVKRLNARLLPRVLAHVDLEIARSRRLVAAPFKRASKRLLARVAPQVHRHVAPVERAILAVLTREPIRVAKVVLGELTLLGRGVPTALGIARKHLCRGVLLLMPHEIALVARAVTTLEAAVGLLSGVHAHVRKQHALVARLVPTRLADVRRVVERDGLGSPVILLLRRRRGGAPAFRHGNKNDAQIHCSHGVYKG